VAESKSGISEKVAASGATASESRWQAAGRALRHRNFQLFFSGQLISLIGTWMQTVAQSWLVYRLTGSGLKLEWRTLMARRTILRRIGTWDIRL
jgi:hypothetical protein